MFGFGGLERWNGMVEWTGLDWTGLDWTGLEWNGMEWNDWNGMNVTHAQCIHLRLPRGGD